MKKLTSIVTVVMFSLLIALLSLTTITKVFASSTPYYTYTTDYEYGWVRTSDAYTPSNQIFSGGSDQFKVPEYVYVDHEDYVYVTDSGLAKVLIYDKDLNFIDSITYFESDVGAKDGFNAVNSVFVTEDKIYVCDSFRKSIFIFDRDAVLHRPAQYNLWMEDVDLDDEFSTGDLMYQSDPLTDAPFGTPVYRIELLGQDVDGKDIIQFNDYETNEIMFVKTDKAEMIGKILSWSTTDFDGLTVLKTSIYAEKNSPIQIVTTPNSPVFMPLEGIGYTFAPRKVVVDTRGNMYIVGARSDNGLIMLNEEGEFLTFFGGNPIRTPLVDEIRSFFLTEAQKKELRDLSNIDIDYVSGVAIDEKGFVYTVTSTLQNNNIKKFNVSGKNYYSESARGWVGAVDLWVGNYGNVIVVEEFGWINEYNADGGLMFSFSVSDRGIDREGLLSLPKSISVDSLDNLYVVDQGNRLLQIYKPTEFTNAVHTALQAYQDGDEVLAKENWLYSLEYATVFDLAHVGLGDAYVRQDRFEDALQEYTYASYNEGISNTYWQVRQDWMEKNLELVFLGLVILFVFRWVFKFVNKKKHFTKGAEEWYKKLRLKSKLLDELTYIKHFIIHPLDGYYEIKRKNRVSATTATVVYGLLALLFIMYSKVTNVIFLDNPNSNVIYELLILAIILSLWVVANYFVCLVNDGEGSFKNVYVSTAMSFTPLLFVAPWVILISNVLTYQEAVFYNIPLSITLIWVTIYFFFMIKEIHNYEVGETVKVIFVSMFTMLIMGIFLFIIYSLNTQIFTVSEEIVRELVER